MTGFMFFFPSHRSAAFLSFSAPRYVICFTPAPVFSLSMALILFVIAWVY